MTDEPKKGLFSSFKKKDNPDAAKKGGLFSRFGKKKDEESKSADSEDKGFFSRFKKKDSEAQIEPQQPVVAAVETEDPDTVSVQPSQWVTQPEDEVPTADMQAERPLEAEVPRTAKAPEPEVQAEAEEEPVGVFGDPMAGLFGTPSPAPQPKPEAPAAKIDDKPATSVFGESAQYADTAPVNETSDVDDDVDAATHAEAAEAAAEEEAGEEKKGFLSRFKRNKKDDEESQQAEAGAEGEDGEKKSRFGFFKKLKAGLSKTSSSIKGRLQGVFLATRKIDEDLLEEIEEMLISTDIGVQTAMKIIEKIRLEVSRKTLKNGEELKDQIKQELLEILNDIPRDGFRLDRQPTIILVVGVNGVGKTTTIGKLARNFRHEGKSVVVCAADTFRAAAMEQLEIWAKRADVEIVMKEGAKDPATVVYDALERVKEKNADVLLIDTAGRLHNNPNLMKELSKVHRIIGKSFEDAPHNVLLILDAVTGQNGLQQAKQFVDKVGVTDLIITKLDGTAKGGIAVAISKELNLPIQYIGVGEQMDDLLPFNPNDFVNALFDEDQVEA